jgi:hypothetical protein
MLLANCLDLLPVYYLLCTMISLFSIKLVMFYSLFLRIKSFGKLLIFPTPYVWLGGHEKGWFFCMYSKKVPKKEYVNVIF